MNSYPKLNFPPIKLRARDSRGRTVVFDRVRSLYVVLTPEEWVRRHVVEFLVGRCGAPLRSIVEEYAVNVNAAPQRADVVVMDGAARPVGGRLDFPLFDGQGTVELLPGEGQILLNGEPAPLQGGEVLAVVWDEVLGRPLDCAVYDGNTLTHREFTSDLLDAYR